MSHEVIESARLRLRPWTVEDAEDAFAIFGSEQIAPWLVPAMQRPGSVETMASVLRDWSEADPAPGRPVGTWAVEHKETGEVVGAASIHPLPPHHDDLEITWQVRPDQWGNGYGAEAGHVLAHHAFDRGEDELFVVTRPQNKPAVRTAQAMRMDWVGETEKYYGLRLHVYRLRSAELDRTTLAPSVVEHAGPSDPRDHGAAS